MASRSIAERYQSLIVHHKTLFDRHADLCDKSAQLVTENETIRKENETIRKENETIRKENEMLKKQLGQDSQKVKYLIREVPADKADKAEKTGSTKKNREAVKMKQKVAGEKESDVVAKLIEENAKLKSELETTIKEWTKNDETIRRESVQAINCLTEKRNELSEKLAETEKKLAETEKNLERSRRIAAEYQKNMKVRKNPVPKSETSESKFNGKWKLVRQQDHNIIKLPKMCANWTKGTLIYKLDEDTFRSDVQLEDELVPEMLTRLGSLFYETMGNYSRTERRDDGLVTEGSTELRHLRKYFMTRHVQNGELKINVIVGSDIATFYFKKV